MLIVFLNAIYLLVSNTVGSNLECYCFLHCSIYIPPHTKPDLNAAYIRSTVRETVRCAEGNIPVYAFFWNCECTHVDGDACTLGLVCVTGQVQSKYCYMKLNTCTHMHTHARTHTHTHTHTHTTLCLVDYQLAMHEAHAIFSCIVDMA